MIRQILCTLLGIFSVLPLVVLGGTAYMGEVHLTLEDNTFILPWNAIYFLLLPIFSTLSFWAWLSRTRLTMPRFRSPDIKEPPPEPPPCIVPTTPAVAAVPVGQVAQPPQERWSQSVPQPVQPKRNGTAKKKKPKQPVVADSRSDPALGDFLKGFE